MFSTSTLFYFIRSATLMIVVYVQGRGRKEDIDKRVEQLKDQIKETKSEYEKEKLQERLARLAAGVAVLKVGGSSEVNFRLFF